MQSIELFSGCGGLALGLHTAGFKHQKLVEFEPRAASTLKLNTALVTDHKIVNAGDVREVDWNVWNNRIDLLAGGPPCQPFSIGGAHKGKSDSRDMWPEAARAVKEIRPKVQVWENVFGLTRPAFKEYLSWIERQLCAPQLTRCEGESFEEHLERLLKSSDEERDYNIWHQVVNAADFGVPQKRKRVIFFAVRRDVGVLPAKLQPTHSRDRLLWDKWVSGEYWERHRIERPENALIPKLDRSRVAKMKNSQEKPELKAWVTVRDALVGLGDPTGTNGHIFQPGAKVYKGHTGSPLDEPAKALKAGVHGVPGGENMMVKDDSSVRYFTIREAATLQCFPCDYQFSGPWSEAMRQLGNAVPVTLGEVIGNLVREVLGAEKPEVIGCEQKRSIFAAA